MVSKTETKNFLNIKLNIFQQTMPSSGVTWNMFHLAPSPSSLHLIKTFTAFTRKNTLILSRLF
jgi:hypothetical protein